MKNEGIMDPMETRRDLDTDGEKEGREKQRTCAAELAGPTATSGKVELTSYDYFKDAYPDMDWTPEGMSEE